MIRNRIAASPAGIAAGIVITVTLSLPSHATAAWDPNPLTGGKAVSTATADQFRPRVVSDGAGGAIVTWYDLRSGSSDIYAQRLSATGTALWTADGVLISGATGPQSAPAIVADGAGGAIIAWIDLRSGAADVYAQRVNAAGVPAWTANGVAVCTAAGDQLGVLVQSDGAGGAFVGWSDGRSGNSDVYAQRVNGSGAALWTGDGVAVCSAGQSQYLNALVPDGSGGVILAWDDGRFGDFVDEDIFLQRLNSAGAAQWALNGMNVCSATGRQLYSTATSDGSGGVIVAWQDDRFSSGWWDIYTQHVTASGATTWAFNGTPACLAANDQDELGIVPDGGGGAILCWRDGRSGPNTIYAQRVSTSGMMLWSPNGIVTNGGGGSEGGASMVPDGVGGVLLSWVDGRYGSLDIFAQRISGLGGIQWTYAGVPVLTGANSQAYVTMVGDGTSGAILAWEDDRTIRLVRDVYAHRIDRYGYLGNAEPSIASVRDVVGDQGGAVKLSWNASYLDADPLYTIDHYRIWRSLPASAAMRAVRSGRTLERDADLAARASGRAIFVTEVASATYYWEYVATQPAAQLPGYAYVAATAADSMASANPYAAFMVEARLPYGNAHWFSAPDSGYSVDNLPPAMPAPFTGTYSAGTTHLHWNPNAEPDLSGYRLYRGSTAGFVPDPGNRIASLADTGYADPGGVPFVYKLTAVDIHGNESSIATLLPAGTTDVVPAASARFFLGPVAPNPLHGATDLRFAIASAGRVSLGIYDVAGRRVRTLVDGARDAGEHVVALDGRTDSGTRLRSGVYLLRLDSAGSRLTRRMVIAE